MNESAHHRERVLSVWKLLPLCAFFGLGLNYLVFGLLQDNLPFLLDFPLGALRQANYGRDARNLVFPIIDPAIIDDALSDRGLPDAGISVDPEIGTSTPGHESDPSATATANDPQSTATPPAPSATPLLNIPTLPPPTELLEPITTKLPPTPTEPFDPVIPLLPDSLSLP